MKYKNILFDLDGTLVNSFTGVTNSVFHSLTYYKDIPTPDREFLRVFIGPPLLFSYMKHFGMDEQTANEAIAHYREYYNEKGVYETEVFEGITDLLATLKEAGCRVGMATSKPEAFAKVIAQHTGMGKHLDFICGATFDGALSEKDEIIAHLFKVTSLKKEESVMIGDTLFDVEGAQKNGIDCIAVSFGFGKREELERSTAVAVAHTVKELEEYLLK